MKNSQSIFLSLVCITLVGLSTSFGQGMKKRASPAASTEGVINGKSITINYSRPSVKGRKIWGGLVPFNKVWRTGANEATTFEISKDVKIQGKKLPKGKYALFTIPGEKEWTIIFNSNAKQWGAYKYNQSKDVLRVTAKAKMTNKNQEQMAFTIKGNAVKLHWEKLELAFNVN